MPFDKPRRAETTQSRVKERYSDTPKLAVEAGFFSIRTEASPAGHRATSRQLSLDFPVAENNASGSPFFVSNRLWHNFKGRGGQQRLLC